MPGLSRFFVVACVVGCAARAPEEQVPLPLEAHSDAVIYGLDDRQEPFDVPDSALRERARALSVALISLGRLDLSGERTAQVRSKTAAEAIGLCPEERFSDQPSAAFCSGTLIAPDLVLTAGHCIDADTCATTGLVFGYQMADATTLATIEASSVYRCAGVVVHGYEATPGLDYAVVRLDRPAASTPAQVSDDHIALAPGTPLWTASYPLGLPLKLDLSGVVRDGDPLHQEMFVSTLDLFGGSSGAGIFVRDTGALVGLVVSGEADLVEDSSRQCSTVHRCGIDECRGESALYAFRALQGLCTVSGYAGLCPCGDGVCDAERGESTSVCALDCGSRCGDAACNGEESPVSCAADCGTCGNAVCDAGEDSSSCCVDCGCSQGMACRDGSCQPLAGPGDACEDPQRVTPAGLVEVAGSTQFAEDDFLSSCNSSAGAGDRVYSFALAEPQLFSASLSGELEGVLALRTSCENEQTEQACAVVPLGANSAALSKVLDPGVYSLVVDGEYVDSAGDYQLRMLFEEAHRAHSSCERPLVLEPIPQQRVLHGNVLERGLTSSSCGGFGRESVFVLEVAEAARIEVDARGHEVALYLRGDCEDASSEIACSTAAPEDTDAANQDAPVYGAHLSASLEPGTYYLFADAHWEDDAGLLDLDVQLTCISDDGSPVACRPVPDDEGEERAARVASAACSSSPGHRAGPGLGGWLWLALSLGCWRRRARLPPCRGARYPVHRVRAVRLSTAPCAMALARSLVRHVGRGRSL